VLLGPARDVLPVRLTGDGTFTGGDPLPAGRFLADAVLSDRQQRRQDIYRRLLGGPLPVHWDGRELLFVWARADELPVQTDAGTRAVGSSLLVIPLAFERPAPGSTVTVPAAFVSYRRLADGRLIQPTLGSQFPVEQQVRFQLPTSVLPLTIERATLRLRVQAAQRRVAVLGLADGRTVPLHEVESPTDEVRVEVQDPELLRLDARGGLTLTLAVRGASETSWAIESLGLEVVGRTADR
jgi:hypothetical protein